jgi:hypothetical protein
MYEEEGLRFTLTLENVEQDPEGYDN